MPAVTLAAPSGTQDIDGLLAGAKWAVADLTYSFPTSASFYGAVYGNSEQLNHFAALNTTQQATVRKVLGMYASVINVTFSEVIETATLHADLRFARSDEPATSWAYYPAAAPYGGDSWYGNSVGWYDAPALGNYAYHTFIHEIGHTLGLKHGQEDPAMSAAHDSMEYTVMTYRSYAGQALGGGYTNGSSSFAQTLMMYDIAALQHMYGANYATNSGNTTYAWNPLTGELSIDGVRQGAAAANRVFMTVWDGGGSDTYDFSNYATGVVADLRPGAWSTTSEAQRAYLGDGHYAEGTVANALLYHGDTRSLIENVIGGSGNDTLIGNDAANLIVGNAGNDTLYGGAGDDHLVGGTGVDYLAGGTGNDVYDVDSPSDVVSEFPGEGTDTVYAAATYALSANVENLTLMNGIAWDISGNALDNVLTGNGVGNQLFGGDGNDTLIGGGGMDSMYGGRGNDVYDVDNSGDVIWEYFNEGSDSVYAAASYALGANIENLTLKNGVAWDGWGNALDNVLTGNGVGNQLFGGDGNDVLIGGGGMDSLYGGRGNDTFDVDSSGDVVWEYPNEGLDTVMSSVTYRLPENVEYLRLTGSASIDGYGNALDNVLWGNAGNNVLDGGTGADTMSGGPGNDTYIVDRADDAIVEQPNEGSDSVFAASSYALSASVENLTLMNGIAWDISGNALDNVLTGNGVGNQLFGGDGNDTLIGGGGMDSMYGGRGNDVYDVDNSGDVIWEYFNEGSDSVYAAASYALGANIENLTLKNGVAWDGWGNALDNVLTGNGVGNQLFGGDGNDVLIGGGGMDSLYGGAGADRFYFRSRSDGRDTVWDFSPGTGGDALDFRDLLTAPVAPGHAADFIRLTSLGGGTVIQVNPEGLGDNFTSVALLEGKTGLVLDDLLADGNLLIA